MIPTLEKVEANVNHSFHVNHMMLEHFPSPLHFHPEVEILLVVQGTGTRFIGDSVERFLPGDLVVIGSNTPHVWYSDRYPLQKEDKYLSEAIYIMFDPEVFGEQFWNLPESKSIKRIIELASRGLKMVGETRDRVSSLMKIIPYSVGFKRVCLLLNMLEIIALSDDYTYLSSPYFQNIIDKNDSDRLNKVYEYVINNFEREITLDDAASVANFSTPAFCRYFKKRVNKTFIQFLNEIRVGHACRLLVDENYPVADICFICGFNNISYFIKQFKIITGLTPLNYRKKFNEDI
jgi:AraC-like DNA-binding protein